MKRVLTALLALGLSIGGANASAPSAEQKAEFHSVCLKISGDEALCSCKADAAMTLIDDRMMGYVIAGMKGAGSAPQDIQKAWNDYVAASNKICKPSY